MAVDRVFILLFAATLLAFGWCIPDGGHDDYESLYLLEITFPPSPGRMESSEIKALYDTITNMAGIKTVFFVSEVGNSKLQAVLDIEDLWTWTTLTDVLSKAGVEVKTEPVVSCDHFAQELKANVTKYQLPFKNPVKYFVNNIFPNQGKTEEEYNAGLRFDMEQSQKSFYETGWELYCFRPAVDVPVRVVYFTNEPVKADFNLMTKFHSAELTIVQLSTVIDLQRLTCDTC